MSPEMTKLVDLLRKAKEEGNPYERDVATHAAMLINNGWPAADALAESQKTLDDAEREGQY
jgi:hypothetical protein